MDTQPASSPHSLTADEVAARQGTDAGAGLSEAEANQRLRRHGPNVLPVFHRPHPLKLLAGQFTSLLVLLLLAASAISLVTWVVREREGLPFDTIVILLIVILNAGLGFFQEQRAEQSLEKLRQMSGPEARVIRDGHQRRLPALELVPGDVMLLGQGDRVSADARVIDAASLQVDESMLTGESGAVLKSVDPVASDAPVADRTSMIFSGTSIIHGRGVALVTATGGVTEVGRIAELIQTAPTRTTPLQQSLNSLSRRLGILIVAIAAVVSAAGLFIAGPLTLDNAVNMLLFGVALAVFAIPEGLPAVMTGALALGTQRMARRHAIIRKLPAVETLGGTTAICSDKTGTLTMGEMTVRELVVAAGRLKVGGAGYRPVGEVTGDESALAEAEALAVSAILCNDASIHEEEGQWRPAGSPTESALVSLALKMGVDVTRLRQRESRLAEEPFSSERKQMSVLTAGGDEAVLHLKGAPEMVLPRCTRLHTAAGDVPLTGELRQRFIDEAEQLATRSLRPLAIARRPVDADSCRHQITACDEELVLLGLAGIADPPRPEAKAAIEACRRAGIEVFMVTGDHLAMASAIAGELGIHGEAITGAELDLAGEDRLVELLEDTRVFARVSPGHKVRIVAALQDAGHTVAVTGDGVNDAPALKRADIGIAMGQTGTDVAREAADMVLADDNFATIVAAVEEGRAIFGNIRKFVAYLLSSNAGGIVTLFFGVLMAGWLGLYADGRLLLPLLVTQILWINLVSNGLPALALGVEPREPEAMSQPPRQRSEPIINRRVWELIALVGLIAGAGTLILIDAYYDGGFFTLTTGHSWEYARTVAFVAMAVFQLYNVFNCRRLTASSLPHLAGNRWLLGAVAISLAMMVAVVHLPPLQRAFETEALAPKDWLVILACGSLVVWAVELFKAASHTRKRLADGLPLR